MNTPAPAVEILNGNDVLPFTFKEIRLKESIWKEGEPHFSAKTIGAFLGYKHPQQSINQILARNSHIRKFSTVIKIITVEGGRNVARETEAFSVFGFIKIIQESKRPIGQHLKAHIADLEYAAYGHKLFQPPRKIAELAWPSPPVTGNNARLLEAAKTERRFIDCVPDEKKGLPGVAITTVYRRIRRARVCEPLNKRAPGFTRFTWKRHRGQVQKVLDLKKKGHRGQAIAEMTGLPCSTVYRWLGKFPEDAA